jgi:hypothetical protein
MPLGFSKIKPSFFGVVFFVAYDRALFLVIVLVTRIGESSLFRYCFARHIFAFGKNVAGEGKVSAPQAQKPKGVLVFFVENSQMLYQQWI